MLVAVLFFLSATQSIAFWVAKAVSCSFHVGVMLISLTTTVFQVSALEVQSVIIMMGSTAGSRQVWHCKRVLDQKASRRRLSSLDSQKECSYLNF